jgi:hypothetical protein
MGCQALHADSRGYLSLPILHLDYGWSWVSKYEYEVSTVSTTIHPQHLHYFALICVSRLGLSKNHLGFSSPNVFVKLQAAVLSLPSGGKTYPVDAWLALESAIFGKNQLLFRNSSTSY